MVPWYFPSPVTLSRSNCYIFLSLFQSDLPASPDADFEPPSPANRSDLTFRPDAEFESLSPSNLSDLPFSPDPDFEPPSPANQSDLPVDDESSLAESLTARQNLSNPLDISFQVSNDCTNKGHPKLIDSRGFSYGNRLGVHHKT